MYTNIEKQVIVRAKGNDVITDVISADNQHFASTFSMQILKFHARDVVASSPSFSRPAARAPRRPCLRAKVRPIYVFSPSHRKKKIIQRCFKRKYVSFTVQFF